MGKFAELFLGMARQSENDGKHVTTEQIAMSLAGTKDRNSRGKLYSDKPNQGAGGLWSKEVRDAFNEGREDDGHLLQESYRGKNGKRLF